MLATPSETKITLFDVDTLTSCTIAKPFVRHFIQREEILVESWNVGNVVESNVRVHVFASATNYCTLTSNFPRPSIFIEYQGELL